MPAHHLPSPSSSASLSPRTQNSHPMSRQHSCSEDESDPAARSALEIRREKNRIKQRNLRLRRANQMADLESTVTTLRSDHHELEDRIAQLEAHEASLSAWVRDLESALSANGQRDHVESLRRMWAGNAGVVHNAPETSSRMSADPLATLATAASSFSPPSRTDLRRWEDEQASRKRRRYEEYEHPHPTHSTGITATPGQPRLPSPTGGRMRIDQLVSLPLPRLNQTSTSGSMTTDAAWNSWNHIPADNTIHYDAKPRVSQDARDVADRPHSASSSAGTTRTWNSPVQSFEIRL